jgi:hypothetical protein
VARVGAGARGESGASGVNSVYIRFQTAALTAATAGVALQRPIGLEIALVERHRHNLGSS